MAQTIFDRGYRQVAVFYTNEPYGSGMNTVFRDKFEALGGKVVATATAEPDVIDLQDQMQVLKAANPQAMFIAPNSVVSATAAMKLAREAGIAVPFFGADIMYDDTIINNNPAIAEGLTISSFPTGTKAFKQALLNEYGKSEQLYAAPQAYDIIHLLQIASQRGAATGEEIKNMLPQIKLADGVSGFVQFDANGEVSDKNYKYDLFQVKNGAFTLLDQ
jgi:branched-chain amino acid transport system substrate-binding protein